MVDEFEEDLLEGEYKFEEEYFETEIWSSKKGDQDLWIIWDLNVEFCSNQISKDPMVN